MKHGAVTHPQARHAQEQEDGHQGQRWQQAHSHHQYADGAEEDLQHPQASEAVSQIAPQRPKHAAGKDAQGGKVTGHDFGQAVLIVEENGQEARQAHKAAERDAVQHVEPPRIGFL